MVKKRNKKSFSLFDGLNALCMTLLCFTILYPFINTFAKSFSIESNITAGKVSFFPVGFTLDSYRQVLFSSAYISALQVTLFITVVGTFVALLTTTGAGYALSRRICGYQIFFMFLLVPKFFNGGTVPTFIQIRALGIYDTVFALFLPTAFNIFNIILARNYFLGLPINVIESAEIDGCSELQLFFKIVLPMSKPIVATLVLFEMVALWNTFLPGIMYIDSLQLQPLQVYVRNVIFNAAMSLDSAEIAEQAGGMLIGLEGIKSTVLMVSVLPIICVYPFMQKYFVNGVNMGAVKG